MWVCGVLLSLAPGTPVSGQSTAESAGVPEPVAMQPGQSSVPVPLARLSGPIELDGVIDESAWLAIPLLPVVQHWPEYEGGMEQVTEIRLAYDDDYLYAAGGFYDAEDQVRAVSLLRDRAAGDDAFDLIVDSFNDDQTALQFTTTPLGVLIDQEIRNDAEFGNGVAPFNRDWNTFWDAATTVTDEGWFVEVRVPLASLGFSVRDGRAVMGVIAARYIARKNEKHIFPAIAPDWQGAAFKPSLAQDVVLEGVEQSTPIWVTPYALTGVEQRRDPRSVPVHAPEPRYAREMGLDLKYGLSSNLTLDVTVNTDFAQVESDDLLVNLDRFNLFVPERRQFFQERSSAFEFSTGGEGRLFYSRRIGLSASGAPRRIFGGARVAGRVGAWDLGVLSLQVEGGPDGAGVNDSALRARRSIFGSGRIGGILTSRVTEAGRADLTWGVDAELPIASERVTVRWGQSFNEGDGAAGAFERAFAGLFWERRNLVGLSYDAALEYSGAGFDPRLGFEPRNDFTSLRTRATWAWRPSAESAVARFRLQGVTRSFWRNADGVAETLLGRVQLFTEFKSGHFLNVTTNRTRDDVATEFALPGARVPAGRYAGQDLFVYFETNPGRALSARTRLWTGSAFDGHRFSLDFQPTWVVSPRLRIAPRYEFHRLWFPSRNERVVADIAALRVQVALDPKLSAEAVVQYSAPADAVLSNLRIRYRFAEGRDLFLVLDEGRDLDDRYGLDSAILGRTDRRLLLKYTYAIRP